MTATTKLMATSKPKLTIYLKNGYKSKLKQYVELKQERLPSVSSTAGEIIEDFIDSLIDQKILSPITEEDVQSEFPD